MLHLRQHASHQIHRVSRAALHCRQVLRSMGQQQKGKIS
jgi:hypothetical protein